MLDLYDQIAGASVPYPEHVPVSMELQDLFRRILNPDPAARLTAEEVRGRNGGVEAGSGSDSRVLPTALEQNTGHGIPQGGAMRSLVACASMPTTCGRSQAACMSITA